MTKLAITENQKKSLKRFVSQNKNPELIATYLFYVEQKFQLKPVLVVHDKVVYQSLDDAVSILEKEGKLWRETEIKIGYEMAAVNDQTTKIYICPFTGKVFANNTHPNPQDAIYDWVSTCKENTERVGGVRAKRFFISEDPGVIKEFALKCKPKEPITKIVFSSAVNGKLYHSKEAVIDDFKANYVKQVSLHEVQNQSRFQIDATFMKFIEQQLGDDKITSFVETLAEEPEFSAVVERWLQEAE